MNDKMKSPKIEDMNKIEFNHVKEENKICSLKNLCSCFKSE